MADYFRQQGMIMLYIHLVTFNIYGTVTNSICTPAEEGKEHTLFFKWIPTNESPSTNIEIFRENISIAGCASALYCLDYLKDDYKTTSTQDEKSLEITLKVKIFNTERGSQAKFKKEFVVKANGLEVTRCTVNIYSKLDQFTCKEELLEDNLQLACSNSPNYHAALCLIMDLSDKRRNFQNSSMTYIYEKSNEEQTYNSTCVFTIPINNNVPGTYQLMITMYPNVTGRDSDKYFGSNHSIFINLELPSVKLGNCPEFVVENIEVNCTCERSDTSLIKFPIGWFDESSSKPVDKIPSHLLTFVANGITKDAFYCKVITSSHWTNANSTVYYSPSILGNSSILQEENIIGPLNYQSIIAFVVGGNAFILSLIIFILYTKYTGNTEIHDYDEIGETYRMNVLQSNYVNVHNEVEYGEILTNPVDGYEIISDEDNTNV